MERHKATEFDTMHAVAGFLMVNGLVLYHCEYRFTFGWWQIEAGTPHYRIRICRDGKARVLTCATARLANGGSVPQWTEHDGVPLEQAATAAHIEDLIRPRLEEFSASHWDEDR